MAPHAVASDAFIRYADMLLFFADDADVAIFTLAAATRRFSMSPLFRRHHAVADADAAALPCQMPRLLR